MREFDNCPGCNANFNGKDIYERFIEMYTSDGITYPVSVERILEGARQYPKQYLPLPKNLNEMTDIERNAWNSARSYGWTFENPKCFRKEVGIEIQGQYDGMVLYQCQECGYTWNRFPIGDYRYISDDEIAKWQEAWQKDRENGK